MVSSAWGAEDVGLGPGAEGFGGAAVSAKKEMYGPGAGYNVRDSSYTLRGGRAKLMLRYPTQVFAGKDGSRGLGKSSLKLEDAVADYSTLDQSETTVLEDWVKYFKKASPRLVGYSPRSSHG